MTFKKGYWKKRNDARKKALSEKETPEESYHKKLGEMIKKVKAETKWRDIFKIVEEAQRRLNGEK